jgi:alcohol dehydrogenase
MKALVYSAVGKKALEDRPKPDITAPTDAIIKIIRTTICGTDLHILKDPSPNGSPRDAPYGSRMKSVLGRRVF